MQDMRKTAIYTSEIFSLFLSQNTSRTTLLMQMHTDVVNTRRIPTTYRFLQQFSPQVLRTKCFNDHDLPFKEEVKATEVGHLFEHILLEKICTLKMNRGFGRVIVNGNTSWNWKKEEWGSFHITIDKGSLDRDVFDEALDEAIRLIELLFLTVETDTKQASVTSAPVGYIPSYTPQSNHF